MWFPEISISIRIYSFAIWTHFGSERVSLQVEQVSVPCLLHYVRHRPQKFATKFGFLSEDIFFLPYIKALRKWSLLFRLYSIFCYGYGTASTTVFLSIPQVSKSRLSASDRTAPKWFFRPVDGSLNLISLCSSHHTTAGGLYSILTSAKMSFPRRIPPV